MSRELLTTDRPPPARPGPWQLVLAVTVGPLTAVLVLILVLLPVANRPEPGALASESETLEVLVLGDSSAGRESCPWCVTYVDQWAAALAESGGTSVQVDDQSWRPNAQPPATIASALFFLRTDPALRKAIYSADVVVLAIGGADVGSVPGSASCRSSRRVACAEDLASRFRRELSSWLAEANHIRRHRPAILRVVTPASATDSPAGRDVARAACQVVTQARGGCVHVLRSTRDLQDITIGPPAAGHVRLSQHGHDVIASELIALGLS